MPQADGLPLIHGGRESPSVSVAVFFLASSCPRSSWCRARGAPTVALVLHGFGRRAASKSECRTDEGGDTRGGGDEDADDRSGTRRKNSVARRQRRKDTELPVIQLRPRSRMRQSEMVRFIPPPAVSSMPIVVHDLLLRASPAGNALGPFGTVVGRGASLMTASSGALVQAWCWPLSEERSLFSSIPSVVEGSRF